MPPITTAHILSHTHWDREWYLNSPYTNAWLVPFFESLFKMLEKQPGYRFVLDGQTSMIEDWIDQLKMQGKDPAEAMERFKGYVRQQRVCVGPYYLQPDWQLVSDEALVRNLMIGQQMAEQWGGRMPVGWLLDNFGQISQTAQIHREFGLRGLFVWRGVEMDPRQIQSEFIWEAPDGSQVTAVYLVGSYRNGMRLAEYPQAMAGRILGEIQKLAPFATTPNVLLMNGYDQEMLPDDILPMLAGGLNQLGAVRVRQSTPPEYLDAITQAQDPRAPLRVLRGALYSGRYISVFPGILSSRMYLKIQNDACQKLLEKGAEPWAAVLWGLGQPYPAAELARSWRLLLKNHPHDSICGVSIDDVHSDMEARIEQSAAIAREELYGSLATLCENIDTTLEKDALRRWVVVNSTPRPVARVVELHTTLPAGIRFCDESGLNLPFQENSDGGYRVALPGIPAMGYQLVYALDESPASAADLPDAGLRVDWQHFTVENALVRLVVNADGTLDLTDRLNQVSYTHLAVFEDGGDAGDTYNYSFPTQDRVVTSRGQPAEIRLIEAGPLRVRIRIQNHLQIPTALATDRVERGAETCRLPLVTDVTLEAHSAVVKFHTQVSNTARDHRLRVLFPTGLQTAFSHAETQFDVVTRPIQPEDYDDSTIPEPVKQVIIGAREPKPVTIFPQRTFVDLNDQTRGLAVLNQGLPEYEILPDQNTIALTLFRGVGWIARPDLLTRIGDAGPLIAVPEAQCLRKMAFDYAVLVHGGDWQRGQVVRQAEEYNHPLLVVETGAHPGVLASSGSFFHLEDPSGQLKLTALKRSEDGRALIVRFYNPTAEPLNARVGTAFQIRLARYANLAEEPGEAIALGEGNVLSVTAGPKKIVTLWLEIEPGGMELSTAGLEIMLLEQGPEEIEDFSGIEPPPVILAEDIAGETARAAVLAATLTEKERLLQDYMSAGVPEDAAGLLQMYRLRLDAASYRRTALEAQLSETLLKKNDWKTRRAGRTPEAGALAPFEATLRAIGDAINTARIEKRALEYVVDYYSRQVS